MKSDDMIIKLIPYIKEVLTEYKHIYIYNLLSVSPAGSSKGVNMYDCQCKIILYVNITEINTHIHAHTHTHITSSTTCAPKFKYFLKVVTNVRSKIRIGGPKLFLRS